MTRSSRPWRSGDRCMRAWWKGARTSLSRLESGTSTSWVLTATRRASILAGTVHRLGWATYPDEFIGLENGRSYPGLPLPFRCSSRFFDGGDVGIVAVAVAAVFVGLLLLLGYVLVEAKAVVVSAVIIQRREGKTARHKSEQHNLYQPSPPPLPIGFRFCFLYCALL